MVRACERAGQYTLATDVRMQAMELNTSGDPDMNWRGGEDGWGSAEEEQQQLEAQIARRKLLRDQRH